MDNEIVSLFVVEHMDLVPEAQNRLLAAKGLENEDKVKLVAHVVWPNRGASSLPKLSMLICWLATHRRLS